MKKVVVFSLNESDFTMHPWLEIGLVKRGKTSVAEIIKGEGGGAMWEAWTKRGIRGERGVDVFPKDGLRFLKALKYQYSGQRVRAGDVFEE